MQKVFQHLRSTGSGVLLSILFALTHLFRLDHHGFWIDELHTVGFHLRKRSASWSPTGSPPGTSRPTSS